jgi:hypothetical protein
MPGPWHRELQGCVFLPRMLEKGRRALESERLGRDLMNGYCFGDFDYADRMLFRFLRSDEARVRELLRASADDAAVAARLIAASRRSPVEISEWSARFRRVNAPFIAMWEADEGRKQPGIGTILLKFFYNYVMMPPVYLYFRTATSLRRRR